MKKILICVLFAALIAVSFAGAGSFIIIDPNVGSDNLSIIINPNYTCTDPKSCPFIIINPYPPTEPKEPIYFFNITPDTTPPVISNVQAELGSITETSGNISFIAKFANISWETNEPSCLSTVEYGFDINYGTNVSEDYCEFYFKGSNSTIVGAFKQNILLTPLLLTSFTEPTTYHYRVWSCDLWGNCAHSDDHSFNVSWRDNHPPVFIGILAVPFMHIGDSHTFKINVQDPDGDPVTIEWHLEGVLVSTTNEYTFNAVSGGDHQLMIIASDGKLNSSFTINVKVAPEISFIVISIPFLPDTTPPVISNVRTMQICSEEICGPLFVLWDTDEPSYFNSVKYGKGKKYDNIAIQEFNMNLSHSMIPSPAVIIDLEEPGIYRYQVTSCDMFGNCASSDGYKVKKK